MHDYMNQFQSKFDTPWRQLSCSLRSHSMIKFRTIYFFIMIMLKLPADFYTKKRLLSTQFHEEQPGELDITRLIENEPSCWARDAHVETCTRKAIVFCDHTFFSRYGNPYLHKKEQHWLDALIIKIYDLLEDGFKLYLLQHSQLCPLDNPEILRDTDTTKRIIWQKTDDVYLMAYDQHRLQQDNVLLIDYHTRPLLFGKNALSKEHYIAEDQCNELLRSMDCSDWDQTKFIVTSSSLWLERHDETLSNKKCDLQIIHLDHAVLIDEIIAKESMLVSWNIQQMTARVSDLASRTPEYSWLIHNEQRLQKLDCFVLYGSNEQGHSNPNLEQSVLPQLTERRWFNALSMIQLEYFSMLPSLSFILHLKILRIFCSKVSASFLSSLSNMNLESLALTDVSQENEQDFPPSFQLDTVKHLSVSKASIAFSLGAFPSIRTLTLAPVSRERMACFFKDSFILHHLIAFTLTINLDGMEGDEWIFEWLERQLPCMPNLKILRLSLIGVPLDSNHHKTIVTAKKTPVRFSQKVTVELTLHNVTSMDTIIRLSGYFKTIKTLDLQY
ncbi:MAG TPA: hypothetical protein DDY37_00565, partial [Legionella sp.]|nr:hypothetical protein [Legionella sp.]